MTESIVDEADEEAPEHIHLNMDIKEGLPDLEVAPRLKKQ